MEAAVSAVKAWQAAFKSANGRAPGRDDVAAAVGVDASLKEAYRVVRSLKPIPAPVPGHVSSPPATPGATGLDIPAADPPLTVAPNRLTLAERIQTPPVAAEVEPVKRAASSLGYPRLGHKKSIVLAGFGFRGPQSAAPSASAAPPRPPIATGAEVAAHRSDAASAAAVIPMVSGERLRGLAASTENADERGMSGQPARRASASAALPERSRRLEPAPPEPTVAAAGAAVARKLREGAAAGPDGHVATSENFVVSDYRRKYRCARAEMRAPPLCSRPRTLALTRRSPRSFAPAAARAGRRA